MFVEVEVVLVSVACVLFFLCLFVLLHVGAMASYCILLPYIDPSKVELHALDCRPPSSFWLQNVYCWMSSDEFNL